MRWQAVSSSWLMVVSTVVITTLGTYLRTSRAKSSMPGNALSPKRLRTMAAYSSALGVFRLMETVSTMPSNSGAISRPQIRLPWPLVFTRTGRL